MLNDVACENAVEALGIKRQRSAGNVVLNIPIPFRIKSSTLWRSGCKLRPERIQIYPRFRMTIRTAPYV